MSRYRSLRSQQKEQQQIYRALARVDELRRQLIDAQNELASLLRSVTPSMRTAFAKFYTAGGVTAEEWLSRQDFVRAVGEREPIGHGQIRLVRSPPRKTNPKNDRPGSRRRRFGGEDGPCAA